MDRVTQSDDDDDEQKTGSISYNVLEMAAFHNNRELLLDWLENSKDQQDYDEWRGSLLRRAAYYHSVDVVECILSYGNCDGQSAARQLQL